MPFCTWSFCGGRRPRARTCGDSVGTSTGRSQPSGGTTPGGSDNGPLSGLPDVAFVPRSSVYEPIGSDGSHALPGPKVSTPPCHQRVADARSIERATQSRHPESADLCAASRPAAYGYPAGANSPSLMVFKSPLGHPNTGNFPQNRHHSNTLPVGDRAVPAPPCGEAAMTAALIAPLIPPRARPGGRERSRTGTARPLPVAGAVDDPQPSSRVKAQTFF